MYSSVHTGENEHFIVQMGWAGRASGERGGERGEGIRGKWREGRGEEGSGERGGEGRGGGEEGRIVYLTGWHM